MTGWQIMAWSVSHSQRASNHNCWVSKPNCQRVYPILKEHQITTTRRSSAGRLEVYPILKEHQITTRELPTMPALPVYPILKEHQITTGLRSGFPRVQCIPFSKSIKSQPRRKYPDAWKSVSHSQRASNHNTVTVCRNDNVSVSHSQRASNHNRTGTRRRCG